MSTVKHSMHKADLHFPTFDLGRLFKTVFEPQPGEKLCILIDLERPSDVIDFAFLKDDNLPVQKKAYEVFYQTLRNGLMQEFKLESCDFFAYRMTGGSNLELPDTVVSPNGQVKNLQRDIYLNYDIILCITTYSATAPLTAASKQFGFRGSTMHGVNKIILESGLSVDYNEVSRKTEKLRRGMTQADSADIDFELNGKPYHLKIELGGQEAQKSHGLCRQAPDIANLPAGEVYFVPMSAEGSFPMKFDDGTIAIMQVKKGRIEKTTFINGNKKTIEEFQNKLNTDPATGLLGELGFGTQELPYSGGDIQDEKIFGTFHIAIGRNDHLNGSILLESFKNPLNATHDDILFSSTKTPEIQVKEVRLNRKGKTELLIKDYEPCDYLRNLNK